MPLLRTHVKILKYFVLSVVWLSGPSAACAASDLQRNLRLASSSQIEWELREEVGILTDSSLSGREFGSGGASGAAFYIAGQLADAGYDVVYQRFESNGRRGQNVIAVTPGNFSSYIVVGAYYDGYGMTSSKQLLPGADSNVSGVVSMLFLARHFSVSPPGPSGPGLIFVAFDGHCDDLAGSRAFVSKYLRSYSVSLMVNLDTVGSTLAPVLPERPDYLIVLGGSRYSGSLSMANRSMGLHLSFDYYGNKNFTDLFYRHAGDQRSFMERGVPSVMFTSGITMNTNRITDIPGTLDYQVMVSRIRLMENWLSSFLK